MSKVRITLDGTSDITSAMTGHLYGLESEVGKAAERAARRTLSSVRTEALKIVRENYTAAVKSVRDRSSIHVRSGATSAYLRLQGPKALPLSFFAATPRKRPNWKGIAAKSRTPREGITSKVRRGGPSFIAKKNGQKPFWAKSGSGNMQLYRRAGGKKEMLWGPGQLYALSAPEVRERLGRVAKDMYFLRLRHELDRILLAGR